MRRFTGMLIMFIWILGTGNLWAAQAPDAAGLDKILTGMETRYSGKGFSVLFFQESMLKAMQISDTAEGRLTVKRPGKMRWEYTLPDPQTIITDGKSMWIYRPADNQVMVGKAPSFFGGGKGAGFLSDIRQVRKSFRVAVLPGDDENHYRLKLTPKQPTPDIAEIFLWVAKASFQVDQVVTLNSYGDETKISLSKYQFNLEPKESLFSFDIPDGVDVVQMDKQ
jgi:outer membrane lipoprotein carrier protein